MNAHPDLNPPFPQVTDELDVLSAQVHLPGARLIELGCGAARTAAALVQRFAGASVQALEVDAQQMAKNRAAPPVAGLHFVSAGAQDIPFADASFDGALMLKSLHHIPRALMDQALAETARVLKPGGWLYVSEPVYAGALNEIVRLYNDEGEVRAAAQAALDRALQTPLWAGETVLRFDMPAHFTDFDNFERRMMHSTYATHDPVTDALRERVRAAFAPHMTADGAHFVRPMLVRLLRRA